MTKGGHHGEEEREEVKFIDPSAEKEGCCARMTGSLRGLCHFMYNPRTRLVMGRTGKQWAQLLGFYFIFYAFLIGFWIACLCGFLATTNVAMPTLLGFQSMLQLNPAIGYRPQPDFESNLIKFNSSNPQTYSAYVNDLNSFLAPYFNQTLQNTLLDCENGVQANATMGCQFWPKKVAPECFPEASSPYGLRFADGTPCIVLKMNRIIGWMPKFANGTYQDVKVRCTGENLGDVENMGRVKFMPGDTDTKGPYGLINAKYLPFMNQPNYLSPLIFARFTEITPFTLHLLWCEFEEEPMNFSPDVKFWKSSVLTERAGGTHFEMLVDKAPRSQGSVPAVPVVPEAPAAPTTQANASTAAPAQTR